MLRTCHIPSTVCKSSVFICHLPALSGHVSSNMLFSLVPCSLYSLTYWFSLPQVCCCLPLANCLSTVYQPIFINRLFSFVKVPFLVTCLLLSYTSLLLPSSITHLFISVTQLFSSVIFFSFTTRHFVYICQLFDYCLSLTYS